MKYRTLPGHEGTVTAVAFDNNGKHIASFSLVDMSLRIWKVGSNGFFGSILSLSGKHTKQF